LENLQDEFLLPKKGLIEIGKCSSYGVAMISRVLKSLCNSTLPTLTLLLSPCLQSGCPDNQKCDGLQGVAGCCTLLQCVAHVLQCDAVNYHLQTMVSFTFDHTQLNRVCLISVWCFVSKSGTHCCLLSFFCYLEECVWFLCDVLAASQGLSISFFLFLCYLEECVWFLCDALAASQGLSISFFLFFAI